MTVDLDSCNRQSFINGIPCGGPAVKWVVQLLTGRFQDGFLGQRFTVMNRCRLCSEFLEPNYMELSRDEAVVYLIMKS